MAEEADYSLYKPVLDSLRSLAAAFAEPLLAPQDAGLDGVALRAPQTADAPWVLALTSPDACPIEVELEPHKLISPATAAAEAAPSAALELYTTLIREIGAHRTERQTLIITMRKDPGPGEIFAAYRRRFG